MLATPKIVTIHPIEPARPCVRHQIGGICPDDMAGAIVEATQSDFLSGGGSTLNNPGMMNVAGDTVRCA
jgi:hypothetical protein